MTGERLLPAPPGTRGRERVGCAAAEAGLPPRRAAASRWRVAAGGGGAPGGTARCGEGADSCARRGPPRRRYRPPIPSARTFIFPLPGLFPRGPSEKLSEKSHFKPLPRCIPSPRSFPWVSDTGKMLPAPRVSLCISLAPSRGSAPAAGARAAAPGRAVNPPAVTARLLGLLLAGRSGGKWVSEASLAAWRCLGEVKPLLKTCSNYAHSLPPPLYPINYYY